MLAIQWSQFETIVVNSDSMVCLISELDYMLLEGQNGV